ncbi:hypothetical protein JOC25_000006 [Solibacillus kalamii]|uniref:Uncharacterized protein n=1 Tax=Solibacillus kalamii TaxID=1748298 RepID=A0ABX3ZHH7_9BACL|nr:hypothetical protein [Solibacillus kalamii]MBM7663550.1 hypothetical protein [Solibacillus kalamii]OUZ39184.1 hypothetical protein CBM15_10010 [Solibacillus kalamii]
MEAIEIRKKLIIILIILFILCLFITVKDIDFSGNIEKTFASFVEVFIKNHNYLLYSLIGIIASGTILAALLIEKLTEFFKERNYKNYKSLGKISTLLIILYIVSLITTSGSNIGPMLFGGVLTFWIALLQENENK